MTSALADIGQVDAVRPLCKGMGVSEPRALFLANASPRTGSSHV